MRKIELFIEGGAHLYTTERHATLDGALADFEGRKRSVYVAGAGLCTVDPWVTVGAQFKDSIRAKYSRPILAIYDNGGKTVDRYTVYYNEREGAFYCGRGMSESPFHPQGFGLYISGSLGRHNGRKILFEDLPADCQKLVISDLKAD